MTDQTSKTEKILAIDPGERVGWARGIAHPTANESPDTQTGRLEVQDQGVAALQDFALKLGKVIGDYDTIIYETWRLYPGIAKSMVGNDMQPAQLVGIIRYLSWVHPNVRLVSQGASIKKTALKTMPEEFKERMARSSEQHDQDALMHLWHYYWRNYV